MYTIVHRAPRHSHDAHQLTPSSISNGRAQIRWAHNNTGEVIEPQGARSVSIRPTPSPRLRRVHTQAEVRSQGPCWSVKEVPTPTTTPRVGDAEHTPNTAGTSTPPLLTLTSALFVNDILQSPNVSRRKFSREAETRTSVSPWFSAPRESSASLSSWYTAPRESSASAASPAPVGESPASPATSDPAAAAPHAAAAAAPQDLTGSLASSTTSDPAPRAAAAAMAVAAFVSAGAAPRDSPTSPAKSPSRMRPGSSGRDYAVGPCRHRSPRHMLP